MERPTPAAGEWAAIGTGRAVPGRYFVQRRQFRGCIDLMLKLLDANRCQYANDRGLSEICRHLLGRAAKPSTKRRKPDDGDGDRTDHCSPDSRL